MIGADSIRIVLDAVIVAVQDQTPQILTIGDSSEPSAAKDSRPPRLPHGPLDVFGHATLERALRQWVHQPSGLELGYVEQLYTFGDLDRGFRDDEGAARVISVAYLALVREETDFELGSARWLDWYRFFPWEDWREGRPECLGESLVPDLRSWAGDDRKRLERARLCFGLDGTPWDAERCLERYELLFEAGLVGEAGRHNDPSAMGRDHRRILATAIGRLRGKLKYRPVVFELLPETFTLLDLQLVVEALAGSRLHKQNFRRLVANQGLVEATGETRTPARGRPAELFRFRREVLRERPAPGVGFSGAKWTRD